MPGQSPSAVIRALGRQKEVARLRKNIGKWIDSSHDAVQPMLRLQFDGLSKYFRPLTIFGCHFALTHEPVSERLMHVAQAMELFHNVTLIIDDVVDMSVKRRDKPTLYGEYGPLTAYMVSGLINTQAARWMDGRQQDVLDSLGLDGESMERLKDELKTTWEDKGFESGHADSSMASRLDSSGLVSMQVRTTMNRKGPTGFDLAALFELTDRLAIAECVQWDTRKGGKRAKRKSIPKNLGLKDWRYLAREDTGCMFEICAMLGARTQRFRRFGRLLGMLYHGCDDLADVKNAKGLGGGGIEDIRDGILTLPAALALEADPSLIKVFSKEISEKNTAADQEIAATLFAAFRKQLDRAEEELDSIQRQATVEAHSLGVPYVGELLALIDQVRPLSGR